MSDQHVTTSKGDVRKFAQPLPCRHCGTAPAVEPTDLHEYGDQWANVFCVGRGCRVRPQIGSDDAFDEGSSPHQRAAERWNAAMKDGVRIRELEAENARLTAALDAAPSVERVRHLESVLDDTLAALRKANGGWMAALKMRDEARASEKRLRDGLAGLHRYRLFNVRYAYRHTGQADAFDTPQPIEGMLVFNDDIEALLKGADDAG